MSLSNPYSRKISTGAVIASGIKYIRDNPQSVQNIKSMARRAYNNARRRFRNNRIWKARFKGRRRTLGATTGQGITDQHDRSRIYKKKFMGGRKKRTWKRFVRKVNAVAEKTLGSRTAVFNRSVTFTNTTAGNQGLGYMALYSLQGVESWMNDLNNISATENQGDPTSAAGINIAGSTKFLFQSGILDMTIKNNTQRIELEGNIGISIEMDVYEIVSSKKWADLNAGTSIQDIPAAYGEAEAEVKDINGASGGVNLAKRGCTPWDVPHAISKYGLKILKKTKYFLGPQQTMTYQIRDPKRRPITQDFLAESTGGNMRKWSRHVLIVFKSVPGFTIGTGTGEVTEQILCGITRKYFYKLEGANQDRDAYVNG